ncbi:MAG: hypothetical protein M3436_00720 [Pseudomonadota bacterium]|nr:hypothetical protein [Pseudomonadota bacterium]
MDDKKKLVEEWNATYPVATRVIVTLDSGKGMDTKTRSEAWLLGGHTAVVMVDGIVGGYNLKRCRAIPADS